MSQSHEQIELRAYALWEQRGRPWGEPEVDWFKAEQELNSNPLVSVARQIGSVLGTAVALLTETAASLEEAG